MKTYKMKKQTPAQTEAEKLKARLTEMLTTQINKLGKSNVFEMDELFELFVETIQKTGCFNIKDFSTECDKICLDGMAYLVPTVGLIQEKELEDFCKEKGIKLLEYWDL